ncbi:hypothetical protein K2X30_14230 [bacterium]|nr:hypothetical protein [bacterium]
MTKKTMLAVLMGVAVAGGLASQSFAHEGHDKTPGSVQAPHGGVVQGTSSLYLELVNDASGIKLYPLTHDLAPIALKDVKITAMAQPPKKAKLPVKFAEADDHFEAKVDAKGSYRYTLEVSTAYKGKKEKLTFQVEPQS